MIEELYMTSDEVKNLSRRKNCSRLCFGKVEKVKHKFIVKVEDVDGKEYVCTLTEQSLNTKGKQSIYSIEKDKTNHYIRRIRDYFERLLQFDDDNWTTVCPGLIVSGIVIKNNDNTYSFALNQTHGIGKVYYNIDIKIKDEQPLFKACGTDKRPTKGLRRINNIH